MSPLGRTYLAARYSRADEMQGVRDVLLGAGLASQITSRWIDHHDGDLPVSFTPDQLNTDTDRCGELGTHDMDDVLTANTVISFTEANGGGKGGRHVEFGIGLATGKRTIIVGPREHIFHTLPAVEHYPDWPALVRALAVAS